MKMTSGTLSQAVITILLLTSNAHAATLENSRVHGWYLGAYSNDETNEFSHCGMSAPYKSGIYLVFTLDKDKQWFMGLSNPQWQLTIGKKYNFDVELDDARGINWFGIAVTKESIRIPLESTADLFTKFSRSRVLTVKAASGKFQFVLDDSKAALQAMAACTQRYLQPGEVIANPFEVQTTRPITTDPDSFYAEAAITSVNMLAAIGTSNYRFLPIDKIKSEFKSEHAVWMSPGAAGSLRVYPKQEPLENITAALIANSAAQCKGKFATGKNSIENSAFKIEVACKQEDGQLLSYFYVVLPRPAGGSYIFTVFTNDDTASSRDAALKISDTILTSQKK
jgi:hypothetical protein